MNPILKNILAVLAGLVVGSIVNMGLIYLGTAIIPPPEGADVTTTEGLKATMHLFEAKNFITPFVAHAGGTLVGALVAAMIAANNKLKFAMAIGALFMIGGIMAVASLPSPMWFNVLDLVGAYIPMAWLGHKFATRNATT